MSMADVIRNVSADLAQVRKNTHCPNRLFTMARCLKYTLKNIAIQRALLPDPASESLGSGFRATFQGYGFFLSLWKEMYLEMPYYFRAGSDAPVILDVGSNIGMSVLFFKKLYPQARITAFEPDSAAFRSLQANVALNQLDDVVLVNKAVCDYTGTVRWHYDKSEPGSLSMSTIARDSLPDCIEVPCVRLSDFVQEPVDFLKLDIEGAEGSVIRELCAAGRLGLVRCLAIEYHTWANTPENDLASLVETLKNYKFSVNIGPVQRSCRMITAVALP